MKCSLLWRQSFYRSALAVIVICALAGCGPQKAEVVTKETAQTSTTPTPENSTISEAEQKTHPLTAEVPIALVDATDASGIKFKHNNGAFGLKLMPETNGSGVIVFDFDNDGRQDLYFVQGRDWTDAELNEFRDSNLQRHGAWLAQAMKKRPTPRKAFGALYRNNGDGTFRDVTQKSGLEIEMLGQGGCAGDYDNDGRVDLYLTSLNRNYLFRNEGKGKFREISAQVGLQSMGWSTSAAWVDYDKDGWLDLFVCRYVKWKPSLDVYQESAIPGGFEKSYSGPKVYQGQSSLLFKNERGRFRDVSVAAGIASQKLKNGKISPLEGKALGVSVLDCNNDLWPDLAVANDRERNFLFQNNGDGTFSEIGVRSGLAYNMSGSARSGMGIDAGDINRTNRDSVVIGNFDEEMIGLYLNDGSGQFTDVAKASEVAQGSFSFLTFGCMLTDVDNDGWLDLLTANGHLNPGIDKVRQDVTYAERPLLFRSEGILPETATTVKMPFFRDVSLRSGPGLQTRVVGRGLASADFDLDGDLDFIISTNGHKPLFLRNDTPRANKVVRVQLIGSKSNRDGVGSVVWAEWGEGTRKKRLRRTVRTGTSFCSQSELPLTIGLGAQTQVDTLAVRWPSGKLSKFQNVTAGHSVTIDESRGIIKNITLTD